MDGWPYYYVLLGAGTAAGLINALAGGGPILTLAVLTLTGIDAKTANLTSTVALSPGQIAAGYTVRDSLRRIRMGSPRLLVVAALIGGAMGAALLLLTSTPQFREFVPWLVMLATVIYAVSSVPGATALARMVTSQRLFVSLFAPLTLYGGYFGGGNSFLVLALLGVSGHDPKLAGDIKNGLIAAINLGAVAIFAASGAVDWTIAVWMGAGGVIGSVAGARLSGKFSPAAIRWLVILCGLGLAGSMFVR